MKILITGNLGYIGPVVTQIIKNNSEEANITGLDIGLFADCFLMESGYTSRFIDCQIYKDVRNVTEKDLNGIDVVVHLAALSNDPIGNNFEKATGEINFKASLKLALLAKKCGVQKFIFASSCSVYGAAGAESKTEGSSLNPLTAYARSKINTEKELENIADKNFFVYCLRFATACGASPRLRLDLVLNDFVCNALVCKKIQILSDGSPWRPLISVNDMGRGILWAINNREMVSPFILKVNVGSNDWNFQVRELAYLIGDITQAEIEINTNAAPDKRSYKVNFDKYKSMAGSYYPKDKIQDVIQQLIAILRPQKEKLKDFRNSDFIRLNLLNKYLENDIIDKNLWTQIQKN